jgi:phosphoribosyl 1,2-cyclic phosphodiesterase
MKLEFLGTRGYIDARNRRHSRHTALRVAYHGRSVAIDCGEDWLGLVDDWDVGAIVVTHAHPDHAWGLKEGAPCPVYATAEAWETMDGYDLAEREVLALRQPTEIEGLSFEAFPVEHSSRAPAVGYRITAGSVAIFYVPDVVWIRDRAAALSGVRLYIGDGATIRHSMVRKIGGVLIGHTPVRTQLTWCQKEGVRRAIITHCGGEIVEGDERSLGTEIQEMAEERGVEASIAYDGLEIVLR